MESLFNINIISQEVFLGNLCSKIKEMKESVKYFFSFFLFFTLLTNQSIFVLGAESLKSPFYRNLSVRLSGNDVLLLQKILNQDSSTRIGTFGAGSPSNETTYFGAKTKEAVIRFQEKYSAEILAPLGLLSGTGYVGPLSIKKLNELNQSPLSPATPRATYSVSDFDSSKPLPEIILSTDYFQLKEGETVTLNGKNFFPDSKVVFFGNFGRITVVPLSVSENTLTFVFSTPYTKGIEETLDELKGFDFSDDLFVSMQKTLGGSGKKIEIPFSMIVESNGVSSFVVNTKVIVEK